MRRSDGTRRRRPPRSVSPGRWGACGGRPHGRVDGDRVSRVMGGVLRSTREEGARLRVPPRGRGAGDDQWCSPPSSCASPLPPLGESARACAAHAASPPSAPAPGGVGRSRRGRPAGRDPALAPVRAARSGCWRRRTVRHPGSSPVRAARPARPPVPTASHCGPHRRSSNSNHSPGRASGWEPHRNRHHAKERTRRPRIREIAGQPTRSSLNPRARRVTREHVPLADVLAG